MTATGLDSMGLLGFDMPGLVRMINLGLDHHLSYAKFLDDSGTLCVIKFIVIFSVYLFVFFFHPEYESIIIYGLKC